ncbi:MAG TPA: DNA internalization-related competence protein ComEC/Rec2 [Elusimicrobia bacterium]|nr:DNA internalization-related competence protein ComEC/Rec2 [Elusimicrobiota bacterium]
MKRPLIAITVSYILIIVLMEMLGILNKIPAGNIARQSTGDIAVITGKIISEPEESNSKTSFILKTIKINGTDTKGNVLVNYYAEENNFSYGDIVEITGKFFRPDTPSVPGTFDYKKYLFRKRIYALLSVFHKNDIRIIDKKPFFIRQLSLKLRQQILDAYEKNLHPSQAAVLSGITIGEKSGLTTYIQKIFIDAGVMHVLVVSGSNVAFVSIIFFWIFRSILRLKKKISLGLLIPIILLYAMITGANPPVLRATIMTLIVIFALLLSRNADVYQGIFLAAFIILIYNPLTLFEAGFQMSFAATLGIIYFFPIFQSALKIHKLPKFFNWLISVFLASLSAQIAILPLMAYYFNKVSIIALVSNLVILPMIGISLGAGFALYFASLIGTQLLFIVSKLTGGVVSLITYLVDMFANVPYSTIRIPTPSIYFILLFYIIVVGLPKIKNYIWKRVIILSFGILILLPVLNYFSKNAGAKNLEITFIDVGLGDAVYCRFPDGSNMLIDGGGDWGAKYDIGETVVSPFLWNKGVTKIDTVILTHPHLNHYQGFIAVCNNFKVKKFITTGEISKEDEYLELMKILRKKKIITEKISAGVHFNIGNISVDVLNPEKILPDTDDNSIVMKLSYNDFSILFCGDITRKIQNILTSKNVASTVLFVPSHGKKRLLLDFLLKISPEYAIISTDMPASKVLEQLNWCKLFATSASGTLTVYTDGRYWKIKETIKDMPMDMIILDFE